MKKISVRDLEMHKQSCLTRMLYWFAAQETSAIGTVEKNSVIGRLGAAVNETVSDLCPVPVKRVDPPDRFAETGPYEELLEEYGMSVETVIQSAGHALAAKK